MTPGHPSMWVVLLEAVLGGVAIAVAGGVAFYYTGLLFLTLVSALLPLAGGRPKMLNEQRRREGAVEDR